MAKIVERRRLSEMPYDRRLVTSDCNGGDGVLCHATGYEVRFEGESMWWDEFVSPTDDEELLYG